MSLVPDDVPEGLARSIRLTGALDHLRELARNHAPLDPEACDVCREAVSQLGPDGAQAVRDAWAKSAAR